jgi:hypothetical protein
MYQMHGHMREMKGWALENWGTLIRDPWVRIAGRRERLLGSLEVSWNLPTSRPKQSAAKSRA